MTSEKETKSLFYFVEKIIFIIYNVVDIWRNNMRRPHQILAFPYKKENDKYIYCIFQRSDLKGTWQGIAGGVEDFDKTFVDACKREANEEAGISNSAKVIELESTCNIPVLNVVKDFIWGEDVYLVQEHSFGIDCLNEDISLSHEHTQYKWCSYEEAINLLKYDSNKTALWELDYKLNNKRL